MTLFDNFLRSCAEDGINMSRTLDPDEYDHAAYCDCDSCVPPRPLSQFDRVQQARGAMERAFCAAHWYAERIFHPYQRATMFRELAWTELCKAFYWRDRLGDLEAEGHEVRR